MPEKPMQSVMSPHKFSFGQLMQWSRKPADLLDELTDRYGDMYTVQLPGDRPVTLVSHPKGIEDIMNAPLGTFSSAQGNEMFRPVMGDYSLLLLDGKAHQRQRKLLAPPYHGERMRLYGDRICELTDQMMQTWQMGDTVNAETCMKNVTLNALLEIVFGLKEGGESERLRQKLLVLIRVATSPLVALHLFFPPLQKDWGWTPWGRFMNLRREFDQMLYDEIARRREYPEPDRTDILNLLMAARDEAGEPLSDRELRDQLVTLLMGGFDTTSTSLVWTLYWIHQTPGVLDKLLAEFDAIEDETDMRTISRLPYLSATCQEALRISPSILVSFIRVAQEPVQVMGQEFPAGWRFWADMYSVQQRPDLYPTPQQFKPERFLERKFSPYEYLPFGGGNRVCIGSAFATYLMNLVIFKVLSSYDLELTDPRPVEAIRRGPGLEPSRPVELTLKARRQRPSQTSAPAPVPEPVANSIA